MLDYNLAWTKGNFEMQMRNVNSEKGYSISKLRFFTLYTSSAAISSGIPRYHLHFLGIRFFEGPAVLWSGEPLEIRNDISVTCFTLNANTGKKRNGQQIEHEN